MHTGLKFYGKTSWPVSGFGLPTVGVKVKNIIPQINLVLKGRDPFGQRRGSGPLTRWDFESANHGHPVTLRRIKVKPQTATLWVISTSGCYAFVFQLFNSQ